MRKVVMNSLGPWLSLGIGIAFAGAMLSLGITQEVPVGRVVGHLTMEENGKPLADAVVTLSSVTATEDDIPRTRGIETDDEGRFQLSNLPAGEYEVDVSAHEHSMKRFRVAVEEAKLQTLNLKLTPNSPSLNLYASQKVFTPEESPKVELQGFVPADKVTIAVYQLNIDEIAKRGGLELTLQPMANGDSARADLERAHRKVRDLSHRIEDKDVEGAFVEPLALGRLPEGFYFISCTAGENRASTYLCVSHLALVAKSSADRTLCFVVNLKSGEPVANAQLFLQKPHGLTPIGQTGGDGLAELAIPKGPPTEEGGEASQVVIVAREGSSVAMLNYPSDQTSSSGALIYGYCERPAYRPGDTVHFKAVVRQVSPDGYRLPSGGTATVEVKDPDENVIDSFTLPIDSHGTFNGSFDTSPEGKPGAYSIECHAAGADSSGLFANVVAYRKPEYSIEVSPTKPYYRMGEKASATVNCNYYYGGAVVGAKVKANIFRTPTWKVDGGDDEESEPESLAFEGGEYSQTVDSVTDATGRATVDFDTKAENDPDVFSNDYVYNVSVSVTEDGNKFFEGDGQIPVVRGAYDLSLEVENPVVSTGSSIDLLVKTTDVSPGNKPFSGRHVLIEAGREVWTKKSSVFIGKRQFEAVTGSDGMVHVSVPVIDRESISFRATSIDNSGAKIVAAAWAYVEGSPSMVEKRSGTMSVILDHRKYEIGQTAKALIQTDLPGGTALLTVQADQILWHKVVRLDSPSTLISIPVAKEDAPNAFVNVAYVRNKKLLRAKKRLVVNRYDRKLKVGISAGQAEYKPGDTAQLRVTTTDSTGHPVAADVSIGVVDEGIYAIAEDTTQIADALYPKRYDGVETYYSFPEIYLDGGDKGSSKIPLRKTFRDTAAWIPNVWTGPTGTATVRVKLPDNLTAWRTTVVGISDLSLVGMSSTTFHVRKDLMVRLELPQFMVKGDHQTMTLVLANDTGRDAPVHLRVEGKDIEVSGQPSEVQVPFGRPQTVELGLRATELGEASISARVWIDGGSSDGVLQSFPVKPHGRIDVQTHAGEGSGNFAFNLERTTDPTFGSLEINLSPSIAGGIVNSLDGLIGFPYGCVEQTMSRFLPSVVVAKAVRELGLPKPKNIIQLPKIVRDSLVRLENMRHPDGGWGWWQYDESNPFMTALVLDGLARAKQSGWDIGSVRVSETLKWGLERLKSAKGKKDSLRDRLYLTYALLQFDEPKAAGMLTHVEIGKLTPSELAVAALAFQTSGFREQAKTALDRLSSLSEGSEGVAYWPPEDESWGEESSAIALVAFTTVRPTDPIVAKIVRHLMVERKADGWNSTRDSSYSIIGLTSYLKQTQELGQSSTARIYVNGQLIRTVELDQNRIESLDWKIKVVRSQLVGDRAQIKVESTGPGACYYSAQLTTLDTATELESTTTDPGLRVDRSYYRIEPRQLENGTMRLMPSIKPKSSFSSGDLIRVEIAIHTDMPRRFVMIDEPLPSNCRISEREGLSSEDWSWWWSGMVIRDDRVAFFATQVPKGTSKVSYTMRAEQPGNVHVLPTQVANMYDPSRHASSAENSIEVSR